MQITFLGQAGLLVEVPGCTVIIDPYLSNSVEKVEPGNVRRVPVEERFFDIRPDVLIFTHDHLDHFDQETAQRFLDRYQGITVLGPSSVWSKVRKLAAGHNYILFDRHTRWSQGGMTFTAVRAVHSDPYAVGVVIGWEGANYYITGDTLYNEEIFGDLPEDIRAVFLPVNGRGNNMNMTDAADFFRRTGAQVAVPVHTGMFDDLDAGTFPVENKVVPQIYKQIRV